MKKNTIKKISFIVVCLLLLISITMNVLQYNNYKEKKESLIHNGMVYVASFLSNGLENLGGYDLERNTVWLNEANGAMTLLNRLLSEYGIKRFNGILMYTLKAVNVVLHPEEFPEGDVEQMKKFLQNIANKLGTAADRSDIDMLQQIVDDIYKAMPEEERKKLY